MKVNITIEYEDGDEIPTLENVRDFARELPAIVESAGGKATVKAYDEETHLQKEYSRREYSERETAVATTLSVAQLRHLRAVLQRAHRAANAHTNQGNLSISADALFDEDMELLTDLSQLLESEALKEV